MCRHGRAGVLAVARKQAVKGVDPVVGRSVRQMGDVAIIPRCVEEGTHTGTILGAGSGNEYPKI
jgi:hypothetical protein